MSTADVVAPPVRGGSGANCFQEGLRPQALADHRNETATRPPRPTGPRPGVRELALAAATLTDGVLSAADLADQEHGSRCASPASSPTGSAPHCFGMIFLNLEDETGLLNVACRAGIMAPLPEHRQTRRRSHRARHRGEGRQVVAHGRSSQVLPVSRTPAARDWC